MPRGKNRVKQGGDKPVIVIMSPGTSFIGKPPAQRANKIQNLKPDSLAKTLRTPRKEK
ncbi:hypothetical protein DSCO28_37720 [Desulfosarcina ovata subsp. sediminis]|uniref:Uncharacterized protein n=1 Tax=Desulfosarcina ovata subsp. sediminis TaxID=885957 RepID=A0A5K7ZSL5_9BACT|nr:hypothetical protein DSCO28_37720 [Desulfosarcina ovata subsp. sediminis]